MPSQIHNNRSMATNAFKDIEKLETDLWEAADNLRANSKLTSSDYFMPVLGIIFLRHAANRFDAAASQIAEDQASGKMPKRKVLPADYIAPAMPSFCPSRPLRLDHAAGRLPTPPAAPAGHRGDDRHRSGLRAPSSACCRRTTASSSPRCSRT
jgi:hypothetical protein